MTALQVATRALAMATAVVVQPTVVARIGLPLASPQLVVVVLAVIALVDGPGAGLVCGFAAGLVGDLLSDHLVGRQTLVLTAVGYAAGAAGLRQDEHRDREERPVLLALVTVGGAVLAALALDAGLAVVLGDGRLSGTALLASTAASVGYSVLIAPFVLPPLRGLLLRADPERSA